MKNLLLASALTLGTVVSGAASAATLGLATQTPSLTISSAAVEYLEFGPSGDLSTFDPKVTSAVGVSPVGFTTLGLGVGFSTDDPTTELTGGFDVLDDDGFFLGGDLIAVGFTEDVIELQFGNLDGSAANLFGSSVLALIAFEDPLGANPFAALLDGDSLWASISLSKVAVAPVPLPAGLPLLLAGLAGMAMVRKRR